MVVTLRNAAKRLNLNQHFVKGRVEGMRIPLERVGRMFVMSDADYDRLVTSLRRDGYPIPESEAVVSN